MLGSLAQEIKDSPTIAMVHRVNALRKEGYEVIDLGVGHPDQEPPTELIQGLIHAAHQANTAKYLPSAGLPLLRELIAEKLSQQHHKPFIKDQILVTSGAKSALFLVMKTILNPGDEIIISTPLRPSYTEQIKLAGGIPIIVQGLDSCHPDIDAIEKHISPQTKAIIINSPNNPSGVVLQEREITKILDIAIRNNLYIISDEVYRDFTFDMEYPSIIEIADEAQLDHIIIVDAFSKNLAIPGWRMGFIAAPITVAKVAEKILSNIMGNTSSVQQHAVATVLHNGYVAFVQKMYHRLAGNRKQVMRILEKNNISYIKPHGAIYFLIKIPQNDSIKFCDDLLATQKVVAIPGVYFGIEGYIRICYATDVEVVIQGIQKIIDFMKQ